MKQKMSIAGILLLAALGMQANSYTVKSPDGKLVVNVACEGGKASYTVDYNGKQMLGTSALGLVANYGDFSKDLTMGILNGGFHGLSCQEGGFRDDDASVCKKCRS